MPTGQLNVWRVDGKAVDFVGLWRLAHAEGYDPKPFHTFRCTDAAEHLRQRGHTVEEPKMSKYWWAYRNRR